MCMIISICPCTMIPRLRLIKQILSDFNLFIARKNDISITQFHSILTSLPILLVIASFVSASAISSAIEMELKIEPSLNVIQVHFGIIETHNCKIVMGKKKGKHMIMLVALGLELGNGRRREIPSASFMLKLIEIMRCVCVQNPFTVESFSVLARRLWDNTVDSLHNRQSQARQHISIKWLEIW